MVLGRNSVHLVLAILCHPVINIPVQYRDTAADNANYYKTEQHHLCNMLVCHLCVTHHCAICLCVTLCYTSPSGLVSYSFHIHLNPPKIVFLGFAAHFMFSSVF